MAIRLSKIIFLFMMAFFCLLVVFSNVTDYWMNYSLVEHVLMMKDLFPNASTGYRAIHNPFLHHLAYITIIGFELLTGLLCAMGGLKLFINRKQEKAQFNSHKNWAIAGMTLGFITWQFLFWSIGGEWFQMWMSSMTQPALSTAFHIYITFLVGLVFISHKDE